MLTAETLHQTLKERFGFDHFRPHQAEIIQHITSGNDALVIMPTGGGKSICYQLPALLKEGLALVISPLISLMNDQVRSLQVNGIVAAAWHSGTTAEENRNILQALHTRQLKILYVSPERAVTVQFLEFISRQTVSLIAIDEAHCVSIWGNDFRPEYAQLPLLSSRFPAVPVIALTATADKATQEDIKKQLQLRDATTFLSSFERPNIYLMAEPGTERLDRIRQFLKKHEGEPGIIYCLARRTTESVAESLSRYGFAAAPYHAEMSNSVRKQVQDDFQFDRIQIVCATIAFGMGIDKPNIRWIVHYNLPKNIENYYQEIGRSGRDGMPAEALLFYSFRDVNVYREFIVQSDAKEDFKTVQREKLDRIWEYSQATHCRTNVILNYFGEYRAAPCGHCDHCLHPLEGFDGTQLTQMALSACLRSEQSVGIGLLTDVLRGSGKKEIFDRGLHRIKTYGAGRDYSAREWNDYITQMINLGYLEIDYTRHSVLKCTPLSEAVLYDGKKVILHKPAAQAEIPASRKKSKKERFTEALMDQLESLTRQIGTREGIPAYAVFPKPTLMEIARNIPFTLDEFTGLPGIGIYKSQKYGPAYIRAIRHFMTEQKEIRKPKGVTYVETLNLFRQGLTLEEIARVRGITTPTVSAHLARLFEKGEEIDLHQFLSPADLILARQAWRASGFSDQLSKVKEQVGDSLDYGKLTMALAILRRERA